LGDQQVASTQFVQQPVSLVAAQHNRQPFRTFGPHGVNRAQFPLQHSLEQEQQRIERLVLRTGRHVPVDGHLRQEVGDLPLTDGFEILKGLDVETPQELFDTENIRFLGTPRTVQQPQLATQLPDRLGLVGVDDSDHVELAYRSRIVRSFLGGGLG